MGCQASHPVVSTMGGESPTKFLGEDTIEQTRCFHKSYQLRAKLGKGAFAQVYATSAVPGGEEVAVKITDMRSQRPQPGKPTDLKKRRVVENEVSILRKVGVHTNCIQIIDDFSDELFSYIVMEKCDYTLLHVLERMPELKEHILMDIITELLRSVSHIHGLSIVHRDIKPDNFLVCAGKKGVIKLCDFGLAAVLPRDHSELKGVYGTAPFMSPEMLGTQGYGEQTDVWSLGVLAYVLLLGQFPFQPFESTAKAMKAAILAGHPTPTFRPKAGLDAGGRLRISNNATGFLKSVLCRDPSTRLTARAALKHPWIGSVPDPEEPSLRPMLLAARRSGAFDTRKVTEPSEQERSLESMLSIMQSKYHQCDNKPGNGNSRPLTGNRRVDRVHSDCSESVGGKVSKSDATTDHTNGGSTFTSSSISNMSRDI